MATVSQESKVKVIDLTSKTDPKNQEDVKEIDDFLEGGDDTSDGTSDDTSDGTSSVSQSEGGGDEGGAPPYGGARSPSSSSASSTSTMEMLSEDPLFLVLCQFLLNNKEENIVTVLDKINTSIQDLTATIKAASPQRLVKKSG